MKDVFYRFFSRAKTHRIEGVSDEEKRLFTRGAYSEYVTRIKRCFDKVSRALYAVPSWAEKVYEKITDGKIVCRPYIFELTVSAYILLILA